MLITKARELASQMERRLSRQEYVPPVDPVEVIATLRNLANALKEYETEA